MSAFIAALLVVAALPEYHPAQHVSGTVRVSGNDQMAALLQRWEKGFRRFHPDVRFESWLKGTASGIYGLEMRTADLALMGRAMNPFEYYGTYERSWVFPVQVEVATGSFATPDKSPAYAVFVHRDNPIAKLTVQQLDAIFGAQRGGGWNGLSWDVTAARGPELNVRTWGQLGATGAWADKPIHVYAPPLEGAGAITYFQSRVMHGADLWNEDLREYADPALMIADLSNDPSGIAYASLDSAAAGVKALPLAETAAGPYVNPTRETVAERARRRRSEAARASPLRAQQARSGGRGARGRLSAADRGRRGGTGEEARFDLDAKRAARDPESVGDQGADEYR